METFTADEAHDLGRRYALAGLTMTPKDCKPIDDAIFLATKGQPDIDRVKTYNRLRGSFNTGWNEGYVEACNR